jgi:hypothetical protein
MLFKKLLRSDYLDLCERYGYLHSFLKAEIYPKVRERCEKKKAKNIEKAQYITGPESDQDPHFIKKALSYFTKNNTSVDMLLKLAEDELSYWS